MKTALDINESVQYYPGETRNPPKEIHEIRVIGTGSAATHIFIDNLSKNLSEDLQPYKISITDTFINSLPALPITPGYDAILVISPITGARIKTSAQGYRFSVRDPSTNKDYTSAPLATHRIRYEESFRLQMFTTNDTPAFWKAEIAINYDISNERLYNLICKEIIKDFKNNNLINKDSVQ